MTEMETTVTIKEAAGMFLAFLRKEGHAGGSGNKSSFFEPEDLFPLANVADLEF